MPNCAPDLSANRCLAICLKKGIIPDATTTAADWGNKPGCRYCQKPKGKGHGPIWILSISQGHGRVRQIPVPAELKPEEGIRRFAEIQHWLKQISQLNQDLLEARKRG
jgi:hypothetical protein